MILNTLSTIGLKGLYEKGLIPLFNGEKNADRETNYRYMYAAAEELVSSEKNVIACLSNISAIIYFYMDDINWAGFYITEPDTGDLVLGPFQGLPACTRINQGKGVCGATLERKETLIVDDVDAFPGHIACDGNSRSEITMPICLQDGSVYGVLDIDSPILARFSEAEASVLGKIIKCVEQLFADCTREDKL